MEEGDPFSLYIQYTTANGFVLSKTGSTLATKWLRLHCVYIRHDRSRDPARFRLASIRLCSVALLPHSIVEGLRLSVYVMPSRLRLWKSKPSPSIQGKYPPHALKSTQSPPYNSLSTLKNSSRKAIKCNIWYEHIIMTIQKKKGSGISQSPWWLLIQW